MKRDTEFWYFGIIDCSVKTQKQSTETRSFGVCAVKTLGADYIGRII